MRPPVSWKENPTSKTFAATTGTLTYANYAATTCPTSLHVLP
jgi:hypothetical protein